MYGEPLYPTVVFTEQNVAGTAVALSGVTELSLAMNKTNRMRLTCQTASIQYRTDGSSPTTAAGGGHLLASGTRLEVNGRKAILAFRFIGLAGASAVASFTLDNTSMDGGRV